MNAKKKHSTKIIGIILLFLGICVISFTAYHFFKNDAKSKTPNSKTSEEIPQTEKPSGNNPDELLNYSFQIYQLPEDAYSILGFSEQRLSEELKDWTYYNGYSQAVSATFYSDMTIDFNLGSYVMQCVLDDPDQTVITMEYLKKRDKITFHL